MFGVTSGVLQLQGIVVIIAFGIALHLLSQLYSQKVLRVSEDDYPNMELILEGAGNSIGMFMLSWVTSFTFAAV